MHVLAFLLQLQPTIVSATQNIATAAFVRVGRFGNLRTNLLNGAIAAGHELNLRCMTLV
jgi:hypothetical protein